MYSVQAVRRARILCGGCKKKYSLAFGSSHCIHCPSNNHMSLLIFLIAVAGVLLILVIAALNLTVTQGMINSLVVYANVIWDYQDILLISNWLWQSINCSQSLHCLALFRLWNRDMFLPWHEFLLKSMVTVRVPHLHCWSFLSRKLNTLFFKIVYTLAV
jgi:hypothetical protein